MRLKWSGKLIEHGGRTGINKSSNLKPWASKVALWENFYRFWQKIFWRFFVWGKGEPPKQQNQILRGFSAPQMRFWIPLEIQPGPLYWQIQAGSTFSCSTKPDTGQCRRILAVTGFWRGLQINCFLYEDNINYQNMVARSGARKNMKLWWKVGAKRRCLEK